MWALVAVAAVGGYVGSIYSWPWLRVQFTGAEAEVKKLEARAAALKAALGL